MLGYTVYQGKETRERMAKDGKGTTFTTATATVQNPKVYDYSDSFWVPLLSMSSVGDRIETNAWTSTKLAL